MLLGSCQHFLVVRLVNRFATSVSIASTRENRYQSVPPAVCVRIADPAQLEVEEAEVSCAANFCRIRTREPTVTGAVPNHFRFRPIWAETALTGNASAKEAEPGAMRGDDRLWLHDYRERRLCPNKTLSRLFDGAGVSAELWLV